MALHLTKVAVGCASADALAVRLAERATAGVVRVNTRYRPTRHAELIGGSLYWIVKHRLVGRQQIVGFGETEDRRCLIELDARLTPVIGKPKRAHQGWRYLDPRDAPADLSNGDVGALPRALLDELSALALV